MTDATGERHYADVRTDRPLVIEFQNSPISSSTIHIREAFYGDMVWVINASGFKDNFNLASEVTMGLKRITNALPTKEGGIRSKFDAEIEKQETETFTTEQQIKDAIDETIRLQRKIDNYKNYLDDYKGLTDKATKWIADSEGNYAPNCVDLYDSLNRSYKERLLHIRDIIRQDADSINKIEQDFSKITSLKSEKIAGRDCKKVPYDKINKGNYMKVYVLSRSSTDTFFSEPERIHDEMGLFRYKYLTDKYDFFLDYSEDITILQQAITELKVRKRTLHQERDQIDSEMAEKVKRWLVRELASSEEALAGLNIQISTLREKSGADRRLLQALQNSKGERLDTAIADFKRQHEEKRRQIMNRHRGFYRLIKWKHEHKAWREASRHVYFDGGEGYLFQRTTEGLFRKVSTEDFMRSLRP